MANITIDKEELLNIISDLMDEEIGLNYYYTVDCPYVDYGDFKTKLKEKLNNLQNGNN